MSAPKALVLSALSLQTGSGLRARYLCAALSRLGWDAQLAAPPGGPRPYSAEMLLGAPGLMAAAASHFDLVLAVKPYPDAWLGLAVARLRGARTVMDVDDDDGGYRGGTLGLLTRILQAPTTLFAQAYSSHHPLLRARLAARHGEKRVFTLEQGVDLSVFQPRVEAPAMDAQVLRLAFTAHLNIACQLDVLLDAVGPWLRAHPQATLQIAGGGPAKARFQQLAAPWGTQVQFLGPCRPEEAAALLAQSHVSLSAYGPSEGNRYRVPMKVAESLAVGTPVVSNLVPGLAPLAPFIYQATLDPAGFGAALNQALQAKDGRSAQGQAWVREHLDWTRVTARFLDQLRGIGWDLPLGEKE